MDEVSKKTKTGKIVKGVLKAIGGLATVSCIVYVGKEVKREYDETVAENNRLRKFINDHDFYEKEQTNFRSTSYVDDEVSDDENEEAPKKFDPNNPVYRQSPRTMRKLGLNPDGTRRNKSKTELVKIGEYITPKGYVVEVMEDVVTGICIHEPTNRYPNGEKKEISKEA